MNTLFHGLAARKAWVVVGVLALHTGGRANAAADPSPSHVPLRDVRVLVGSGVSHLRIRGEPGLRITDGMAGPSANIERNEWVDVRLTPEGSMLAVGREWPSQGIVLESPRDATIRLSLSESDEGSAYAGRMRVTAINDELTVVNEVDLEHYVGCVVANEVWPDFETEAFRTQAIVTRTYVLYHMLRRPNAPYDVVATQGSQVYRGIRADTVGRQAHEAAEYTRGLVCTYRDGDQDRVFCAYYSAACGGMSQAAAKLGAEGDIEPLAGGVKCDYCRIAPGSAYRWGPVRIAVDDVQAKLSARYPEFAALGRIAGISTIEKTPAGRSVTLRITGSGGTSRELLAERFRLAVGPNVIRSTDCKIRVERGEVVFEDGRGFGHGLGLCQWGMQGQALQGKTTAEILRYYYPGSRITRVY